MSFIDNDPPKHLDIGSLTSGKNYNIYNSKESKSKYKYNLYFTMDEKRALIKLGEKPISDVHTNSKKVYENALKMQERARQYIERGTNSEGGSEIIR
ncbi:MAG: hypothetical protein J6C90_00970 [Clostridia bacterium]|nr:hypothetical protein [Clostridia bacterium]